MTASKIMSLVVYFDRNKEGNWTKTYKVPIMQNVLCQDSYMSKFLLLPMRKLRFKRFSNLPRA